MNNLEDNVLASPIQIPTNTNKIIILEVEGFKDKSYVRQFDICCLTPDDTKEERLEKLETVKDRLIETCRSQGLDKIESFTQSTDTLPKSYKDVVNKLKES